MASRVFSNKISQHINTLPIIWLFTGVLLVPNGQTYFAYFLVFSGIFNLVTKQKPSLQLSRKYVIYPTLFYLASLIATYIYDASHWPQIRCCLYILFYSLTTPLTKRSIESCIKVLPITSLVISLLILFSASPRELYSGAINAIPTATILTLYISFQLYYLLNTQNKILKTTLVIGVLCNIMAVIHTETRSAMLFILLLPILFISYMVLKKNLKIILLSTVAVIILALSTINNSIVSNDLSVRYENTIKEIDLIARGDMNSSIGIRLQLWHMSYELLKDKYFIFPTSKEEIDRYANTKGNLTREAKVHYRNMHNQFLYSWVKSGIIGVIGAMLLIFSPLLYFIRVNRDSIFLLPTLAMFIASLTESPLIQTTTLQSYLISMIIMFVAQKPKENQ